MTFETLQDFAKYIQVNKDTEIALEVYNTDTEQTRQTILVPKEGWGGDGLIGADISFGFFNTLPLRKIDKKNQQKRDKMKGIFSKLTDDAAQEDDSESEEETKKSPAAEKDVATPETPPPRSTPEVKEKEYEAVSSATTESIDYYDEDESDEDTKKYFAS